MLGIKLRANIKIKGIKLNEQEIKNVHYADDLWLALEPTEDCLRKTMNELDRFAEFSGLTINYSKSVAKIVGPCEKTDPKIYTLKPLHWSDSPIRILGSYIDNDMAKVLKYNYDDQLDKVKNILNNWSHRNLTVIGKITVYKYHDSSTVHA